MPHSAEGGFVRRTNPWGGEVHYCGGKRFYKPNQALTLDLHFCRATGKGLVDMTFPYDYDKRRSYQFPGVEGRFKVGDVGDDFIILLLEPLEDKVDGAPSFPGVRRIREGSDEVRRE